MDERELIRRCVSGDEAAWSEFVRAYTPLLRALARAGLRGLAAPTAEPDLEDVVAGTLHQLVADDFRALRVFRWQCSLESWLKVVVRTVCVRGLRRKRVDPRNLPPPPPLEPPLQRVLAEETLAAVRQALEELPDRERSVISMFFVDGKSYRDISEALGLPMGTVATVVARTRARLRALLESRGLSGDPER